MLGKLIKFVVFTRISKTVLIINSLFLFLEGLIIYYSPSTFSFYYYYVISSFSFTILVYSLASGFMLTKSDVYYLLTLPIEHQKISIALFIGNFVVGSYFLLFFGIFTLKLLGLLGILVTLAFSLIAISISIALTNAGIAKRAIVGGLLTLWYISPTLKFYYSPTAIFLGYSYNYVFLTLLVIISLYLALRNIDNIKYKVLTPSGESVIKKTIDFSGKSPFLVILTKSFSFFEVFARVNYMGNVIFKSIRVNVGYVLLVTFILSAIYYVLESENLVPVSKMMPFIPIIEIIFLYYVSFSAFSFEPLWIGIGLFKPVEYARYYLISKALVIALIFLPVSVALLLNHFTVGLGISMILAVPLAYIYLASIQARINPFQIKEENMPNYRYTIIQYVITLLSIPVIIVLYLPVIIPGTLSGLISGVMCLALALPFLISSSFWEQVENKMVENGFV